MKRKAILRERLLHLEGARSRRLVGEHHHERLRDTDDVPAGGAARSVVRKVIPAHLLLIHTGLLVQTTNLRPCTTPTRPERSLPGRPGHRRLHLTTSCRSRRCVDDNRYTSPEQNFASGSLPL